MAEVAKNVYYRWPSWQTSYCFVCQNKTKTATKFLLAYNIDLVYCELEMQSNPNIHSLGLTGSIAMGKSMIASCFRARMIPVFDADAVVHELYSDKLIDEIRESFPGAVVNNEVNRNYLSALVINDINVLDTLETIICPYVISAITDFLLTAQVQNTQIALLEVPLLFEWKLEYLFDSIIVATTPAHIQRKNALMRPEMSDEKFDAILSRQLPDEIKKKQADFVIDTTQGINNVQNAVDSILSAIR